MTNTEKDIIVRAIKTADVFGIARTKNAQAEIIDAGFEWTEEHETFCCTYVVEGGEK